MATREFDSRSALAFVIAFGVVSFFADAAYEGMHGLNGEFLGKLGASGAIVGAVAGGGELAGYLLRLFSGRLVQRTGAYWPITIAGYALQMAVVPLSAFAFGWPLAASFMVLERAAKALRNPATSTMLARAGDVIGHGWAFGVNKALDQAGAIAGPLLTALVLALHGDYRAAYLWLAAPAALTVITVVLVAIRFSFAGHITASRPGSQTASARTSFWWYAIANGLIGFGFADFSLIALHFSQAAIIPLPMVPVFYALAMAASGAGALVFGRWFDSNGLITLLPALLLAAFSAPLLFLGGWAMALAGVFLWGLALGAQGALASAGIARLAQKETRAASYGTFFAVYGVSWFLGSALLGALYDRSLPVMTAAAVLADLIAIIPLLKAIGPRRR